MTQLLHEHPARESETRGRFRLRAAIALRQAAHELRHAAAIVKRARRRWLVLGAIMIVVLVAFALWAGLRHRATPVHTAVRAPAVFLGEASPPGLPTVEPVTLLSVDPVTARKLNEAVPFFDGPNPAARPFHLITSEDDFARALDCLAAAVIYEAGDDAVGERAVAQVILNRLRHPAFPKTVCGVVFQGSERTTGCQFTFTCDGAMARVIRPEAWDRARTVAREALSGSVFAAVGWSTHYHTDWVVPYWSGTLDKVARVETHLFFRWRGWWGTPRAFAFDPGGAEPIVPKMAALSDVHKPPETLMAMRVAATVKALVSDRHGSAIGFAIDPTIPADRMTALALSLCGTAETCQVIGWKGAALPDAAFDRAQIAHAAFVYVRAPKAERSAWDCAVFKRGAVGECLTPQDVAQAQDAIAPLPPVIVAAAAEVAPPVAKDGAAPDVAPIAAPPPEKKKRRSPCAAMRGVAMADRVGPCARDMQ